MQHFIRKLKKYIAYLIIVRNCREGFSVLLHGVGSKRMLIKNFYKKIISDEPTLIVNGFFPSLTIKEVSALIVSTEMNEIDGK